MSTQDRTSEPKKFFWRQVDIFDGFDIEKLRQPHGTNGLIQYDWDDRNPFSGLVTLYAKVGLHRYNFWKDTSFELSSIKKFNKPMGFFAKPYFITLDAKAPAGSQSESWSHKTFQVYVAENCLGRLDLRCYVARPKEETNESANEEPFVFWDNKGVDDFYKGSLPDWPSQNAFADKSQFYILNRSKLRYYDWIRLYLEVAVCSANMLLKCEDLSKLEIVAVAVQTKDDVDPPHMRLCASSAIFYIRFKDVDKTKSLAIVRRIFDKTTGHLSLEGRILSASCLSLTDETGSVEKACSSKRGAKPLLRRRLGAHRLWRLSNPRNHAFKKHAVRSPRVVL